MTRKKANKPHNHSNREVYSRSLDILWKWNNKNEITIMRLDELNYFFALEGLAALSWEMLDGKNDLRTICQKLQSHSSLPEHTLLKELQVLIQLLKEEGLISSPSD